MDLSSTTNLLSVGQTFYHLDMGGKACFQMKVVDASDTGIINKVEAKLWGNGSTMNTGNCAALGFNNLKWGNKQYGGVQVDFFI